MNAIRNRIALYCFSGVVALAPLPFGSTDEIIVAAWAVVLGGILVFSIPLSPTRAQSSFLILGSIVVIVWAGVLFAQTTSSEPLTSHFGDRIWSRASDILHRPLAPRIAVVRDQSLSSAGPQIVAALALFCGFLLGEKRASARLLLSVVAWSGVIYGIYAVVSFALDPTSVLGREKVAYRSVLTGTFINRNTAAVYFGVCANLWLLRLLRGISGPTFRVRRYQLTGLIQSGGSNQVTLSFAAFILLLSATFMTGSRAGSLLFIFTSFGVLIWAFWRTEESPWCALVGGAVLLMVLMAVVGAGIAGRVAAEGLVDSARVSVYRSVLRLIAEHPLWGTGLGTFASVFPSYRPSDISSFGVWDRAHSTPLELCAEQGIPFAVLVVFMVGLIFVRLINGIRRRREGRIFPLFAGIALALTVAHSLVDFSLQIPGLTIVVMGMVGVGLAQCATQSNRNAVASL